MEGTTVTVETPETPAETSGDQTVVIQTPPPAPPAAEAPVALEVGQLMAKVEALETRTQQAESRAESAESTARMALERTEKKAEPESESVVVPPAPVTEQPTPKAKRGLFGRIFLGG